MHKNSQHVAGVVLANIHSHNDDDVLECSEVRARQAPAG